MARPLKAIDWDKVDRMIEAQCKSKEIIGGLGIDDNTFYRRFKAHHGERFEDYACRKSQYGLGLIRTAQMQKALNNSSKGNAQMLIHLGKVLLGQTDTTESEKVKTKLVEEVLKEINASKDMIITHGTDEETDPG